MTRPKVQAAEASAFRFSFLADSTEMAVRKALADLRQALDPLGLDVEELDTVELVLAEILNNIVEHAYATRQKGETITIHGDHRADGLHLRIRDRGAGMPGGKPPPDVPRPPATVGGKIPEGGFGWFLIRDLAKDVRYRRYGSENLLDLCLPIGIDRRSQHPPSLRERS